jgi:hypothetical protein
MEAFARKLLRGIFRDTTKAYGSFQPIRSKPTVCHVHAVVATCFTRGKKLNNYLKMWFVCKSQHN